MTALDPSLYKIGQTVYGTATLSVGKTRPPRAFEEGDLISIMDDIGRYAQIDKDDMAILKERNAAGSGKAGIGTARTRGETIKKCFSAEFLERYKDPKSKKTYIRPTAKAFTIYDLLIEKPASRVLVTPEMTAKWESGLKKIENGTLAKEKFLSMISDMVVTITKELMANPTRQTANNRPDIEPHPMDGEVCPKCKKGKLVTRVVSKQESKNFGKRFVSCDNKPCGFFGEFID